ncbi:histidinol dehydrogenase, partial [Enterobacter hormaechei]|uniref:histidinol dehydrogenase n=1 Tax=Enterobacter hormaechei TaxID=158836 RepID=UPI0033406EB8
MPTRCISPSTIKPLNSPYPIVPATVAGCEQIIACLPPGAHPAMIAVCHLAGAHRIFRVGGA